MTSILALYDIVATIHMPILDRVARKRMSRLKIRRPSDDVLDRIYEQQVKYWLLLKAHIPEYDELFNSNPEEQLTGMYRTEDGGHVMFRPIGQKAFARALRVIMDRGWKMEDGIEMLSKIPMEISMPPWEHVLWNPGTKRVNTKVSSLLPENICLHYVNQEPSKPNYDLLKEYRKALDNLHAELPEYR